MGKRTAVIWNGNASASENAAALRAKLLGCPGVALHEPTDRAEAIATVQREARSGVRTIIAAGGDGTISSVVNGLCSEPHEAALGILPLGTGNDLCRTLGIPLDAEQAAELLWPILTDNGPPRADVLRRIDVIEAQAAGRTVFFANALSGGNAGEVTKNVTAEMKKTWGPWCYVHGAIAVMSGLNDYETTLTCDGTAPETFRTWAILVANGRTAGGGVEIAPRADLEDGLMEVVLILESTPVEAAILTTNYLLGNFLEDERVVYRQGRTVSIQCEPDARFVADGEALPQGPLALKVKPRALKVIAPPSAPAK